MAHFRTKARAIDLLGKGQIADLPTAITELWKNGYDAYGDNLEAHLFLSGYEDIESPLFVISDDGLGMSKKDIIEKWIVLGTDSKTRREIPEKPGPETLFKEPRIPTGEKGIGRLSVAYLGSQMLMLTKKQGQPLLALFFDWRITENYNLFVDDIEIPLLEVKKLDDFDLVLSDLKDEFLLNFSDELDSKWSEQPELKKEIIESLNNIDLNGCILAGPINELFKNGHGTVFVTFNPIDQLLLLKDHAKAGNEDDDTIEYIHSGLSGLSNVFKKEKPVFETKFLIYEDAVAEDFINQRDFFEYKDFETVDHVIDGVFNQYGEFKGRLKVYNEDIPDHSYKPNSRREKTSFGSFSIKLGIIPGSGEPTTLDDEEFKKLNKRLARVGGLYVYRDGFRVLPYGRTNFDFLRFEDRRSRGAGYYFFSYRRMFGYIEISRDENEQLKDKAGREGLINNKAYREFTKLLIAFFVDLARRYYGRDAKSNLKRDQQDQLNQEKQEKEREKELRKEFVDKLKSFPKEIDSLISQAEDLIAKFEKQINGFLVGYDDIRESIKKLKQIQIEIDNYTLTKPDRFTISDSQRERLFSYQEKYSEYKSRLERQSKTVLEKAQEKLKEEELLKQFEDQAKQYESEVIDLFTDFQKKITISFNSLKDNLVGEKNDALKKFRSDSSSLQPDKPDRDLISDRLEKLETAFRLHRQEIINRIEPFVEHLSRIRFDINEEALVGYYKLEFEKLKKQWEETQELAQLGIAVEIIDHQFNALYSRLANIISNLKKAINKDDESQKLYDFLQSTFEHLESNYKLLTPLYRSTGRTRKEVSGQELLEYIQAFFEVELEEREIKVHCSKEFEKSEFYIFESIIKPVFVNVVNNAIYWLKSSEKPEIYFDYKDDKMLIMNTGEPIDDVYVKDGDLFKLFFSRRPKGRGIGLYLAKTNLNSIGFEIEATNNPDYNRLNGACFMIYEK